MPNNNLNTDSAFRGAFCGSIAFCHKSHRSMQSRLGWCWVASCEIKHNNNETMKIFFSILFLTLFSTLAFAQETKSQSDTVIVAGKGWGKVQVDANRKDVEAILGKGEGSEGSEYLDGVYFREYPEMGIQVSYTHKQNKVVAIFFYNKQHRYENMTTAPVKTNKGIDWSANYKQVKKAYGKPKENYSGDGWRRVVYEGIDFRFENDVMVRIGIPGR
ncbi:MAG: hypothetical protein R2747_12570 [Pyrinomonadaceae bacterium]